MLLFSWAAARSLGAGHRSGPARAMVFGASALGAPAVDPHDLLVETSRVNEAKVAIATEKERKAQEENNNLRLQLNLLQQQNAELVASRRRLEAERDSVKTGELAVRKAKVALANEKERKAQKENIDLRRQARLFQQQNAELVIRVKAAESSQLAVRETNAKVDTASRTYSPTGPPSASGHDLKRGNCTHTHTHTHTHARTNTRTPADVCTHARTRTKMMHYMRASHFCHVCASCKSRVLHVQCQHRRCWV